jgi:hypothetical protein
MALTQQLNLNFAFEGKPLPWQSYFQAFEMFKSMTEKASQAVFSFLGVPVDAIAKASLAANKNFQFRWGNGENRSIPHDYVIHSIDHIYQGDAATVKLNLMDNRLHMMANSAFSSYPHQSFSDIVKSVAGSYSHLPPAVVEPAKFLTNLVQTGCHHWAFLSALHREGANASSDGASDYRLFFKGGNELHFHPPDYKQAPYRTINLFSAALSPQVMMRLAPWKSVLGGSTGYKASSFLRDEVRPFSASSSEATAFSGETALGNRPAEVTPVKSTGVGAFLGKYFRSAHHSSALVERDADCGAQSATISGDSLELTLEGDPGLEPGQLVSIVYRDRQSSSPREADGLWLVEDVYHHILGSVHGTTKFKVTRTAGTSISGGTTVPGLKDNANRSPGSGSLSSYDGKYSTYGSVSGTSKTSSGIV